MISMFGDNFRHREVLFHCDNIAVCEIINKQTSKNPRIMCIVRKLVLLLIAYNINLKAKHVKGTNNTMCDKISRFQVSADWMIQMGMQPHPLDIPRDLEPNSFMF